MNNTTDNRFVSATGYNITGADVTSVSVNTSSAVYSVNLEFSEETTPPVSIMVLAWDPDSYKYEAHPYRVDAGDFNYVIEEADYTHDNNGQWTAPLFTEFGSKVSLNIDVRQQYIKYGNSVAFPPPSKYAHAFLIFTF